MARITECYNYSDKNGNKIIGKIKDCELIFEGKNSVLTVGDDFETADMRIRINSNCNITIGSNVVSRGSFWNFYDNTECTIGCNCRFKNDGFMSAAPFSSICIGNGFTVEFGYIIIALPHTQIRFGEDCMLSRRVCVQSNDGHDIFDVRTGKNINTADEKKVIVGNHVWIGQDAMLMYNTDIGDGSIIGAKSLVKHKIPNNCIAAGNPSRIIKSDIAWSRGYGDMNIDVIDSRYVRLSEV